MIEGVLVIAADAGFGPGEFGEQVERAGVIEGRAEEPVVRGQAWRGRGLG